MNTSYLIVHYFTILLIIFRINHIRQNHSDNVQLGSLYNTSFHYLYLMNLYKTFIKKEYIGRNKKH